MTEQKSFTFQSGENVRECRSILSWEFPALENSLLDGCGNVGPVDYLGTVFSFEKALQLLGRQPAKRLLFCE